MAETIEDYKKQVDGLEKRLALYEKDATYRGYYALNKIVNQQVEILQEFNIKDEIGKNPKDDKYFDRTKGLWEGLKGMILDLNSLKTELKLTGNEDKDSKNVPFIERIATKRD